MVMMILDLVNFKVRLLSTVISKTSLNACKKYAQLILDYALLRPKPGRELAKAGRNKNVTDIHFFLTNGGSLLDVQIRIESV